MLLNCINMDMFIPGLEGENGVTVARYRGQKRNVVNVSTESCRSNFPTEPRTHEEGRCDIYFKAFYKFTVIVLFT